MADERLSGLQKYIITAAYRKTVLREELPKKMWFFKTGDDKSNHFDDLKKRLYFSALYESDVLMNYYERWAPDENYGYKGGSNKEKTALRRSLKTLYERGYINSYWQWSIHAGEETGTFDFAGEARTTHEMSYQSRAIITLTKKGTQKAIELLKVVGAPTLAEVQQ